LLAYLIEFFAHSPRRSKAFRNLFKEELHVLAQAVYAAAFAFAAFGDRDSFGL
jgi:hypothetical protein